MNVDYSPHYLEAKRLLRDVYETANERDMETAVALAEKLMVESRLLLQAIKAQRQQ
jgi:hypothetical protein